MAAGASLDFWKIYHAIFLPAGSWHWEILKFSSDQTLNAAQGQKKGTSFSLCWLFKGHTVVSLLCTSLSCWSFSKSSVLRSSSYFRSVLVNILQQRDDSPSLPALTSLSCHWGHVLCWSGVLYWIVTALKSGALTGLCTSEVSCLQDGTVLSLPSVESLNWCLLSDSSMTTTWNILDVMTWWSHMKVCLNIVCLRTKYLLQSWCRCHEVRQHHVTQSVSVSLLSK